MKTQTITLSQKLWILWRTAFHPRTPVSAKALLGGALLYGILPFDAIPDILPIIGLVDDATVWIIALLIFLHMTKSVRANLAKGI